MSTGSTSAVFEDDEEAGDARDEILPIITEFVANSASLTIELPTTGPVPENVVDIRSRQNPHFAEPIVNRGRFEVLKSWDRRQGC